MNYNFFTSRMVVINENGDAVQFRDAKILKHGLICAFNHEVWFPIISLRCKSRVTAIVKKQALLKIRSLSDIKPIQRFGIKNVAIVTHNEASQERNFLWAQLGTIQRPPDYESAPKAFGVTS